MNNMIKTVKKKKVLVAMSGGVDSSVVAKLLQDQGYDVSGVFLFFWKDELHNANGCQVENKCCGDDALFDARRVCQKIGIPLYTLNYRQEFKNTVVDDFISEYKRGRTPNPCVVCNKNIKLGLLIDQAREMGFDYVATGHYIVRKEAKNKKSGLKYKLFKSKDETKDQTYFLYNLNQKQLQCLLFPIGEYKKDDIRKIASRFKLGVAHKKDSSEICFIPEKTHNDFLKRYIKFKKGLIKDYSGKVLGEHQGLPLYTVGQRKGIEIGGDGPYYAAKADYKNNILYVVNSFDDPRLFRDELMTKSISWLEGNGPKFPFSCQAVIRYHHPAVDCIIMQKKDSYLVKFKEPQRAITSGQSVVFYQDKELLGGGIIA